MATQDRRVHPRVDSLNLLTFSSYDANEDKVAQGMGRTLNVSESGILLETSEPIGKNEEVSLTIALREEVVTINGRVVRASQGYEGKYESGIQFHGLGPREADLLNEYIHAFKEEYRRRHVRVDSINLIAYKVYDKEGRLLDEGMGRTLNVSESGILLETQEPVENGMMAALNVALRDDVMELKGTVVRYNEGCEGRFESGIEFFELDERDKEILRKYIDAFRREYHPSGQAV